MERRFWELSGASAAFNLTFGYIQTKGLEGAAMKGLFWLGLVVLVLGVASLFVSIPRSEREGIRAGNVDIGVQVKHQERVPPIITAVLIIGGASMMIVGGRSRRK